MHTPIRHSRAVISRYVGASTLLSKRPVRWILRNQMQRGDVEMDVLEASQQVQADDAIDTELRESCETTGDIHN